MSVQERGQAIPLLTAVLVLGGVIALLISELGLAAVERAQAQAAADAVALAAASSDPDSTAEVARANRARIGRIDELGDGTVRARVRVGRAGASAVASRSVGPTPAIIATLAKAELVLGRPISPRSFAPRGDIIVVDPVDAAALNGARDRIGLCPTDVGSAAVTPDPAGASRFAVCDWTLPS